MSQKQEQERVYQHTEKELAELFDKWREDNDLFTLEEAKEVLLGTVATKRGTIPGQPSQATLMYLLEPSNQAKMATKQFITSLYLVFDKLLAITYVNDYWIRVGIDYLDEIIQAHFCKQYIWCSQKMSELYGTLSLLRAYMGFERKMQNTTITTLKEWRKEEESKGAGLLDIFRGGQKEERGGAPY